MNEMKKWNSAVYYRHVKNVSSNNDVPERFWEKHGMGVRVEFKTKKGVKLYQQEKLLQEWRTQGIIDNIDVELICRLASSVFLTIEQLTEYLQMSGVLVEDISIPEVERVKKMEEEISQRLDKLWELQMIERIFLNKLWILVKNDFPIYRVAYLGQELARMEGVEIHCGNRYISRSTRLNRGQPDTPMQVLRILEANQIALKLLQGKCEVERFEFMRTLNLRENAKYNRCITRSALTVYTKNDDVYLFEVFRRNADNKEEYEDFIRDKVRRYLRLVHRKGFLSRNNMGMKKYPKLVICGEDESHVMQIKELIRPVMKEELYGGFGIRAKILYLNDLGVDAGAVEKVPFKESKNM